MKNPFKYGCVVSGDHFCLRPKAECALRKFAESGQNVVVLGERRMGKTSLVRRALAGMRGRKTIFIDLYYVNTQADLCRRIMEGVGRLKSELSFLQKVMAYVPRLRPVLSFDATDGSPKISLDARAALEPESLDSVMSVLEKLTSDGKTTVVFDEFQDIRRLSDSDRILAEMRGRIQLQEETAYFFLGSVRHEMWDIFNNSNSPFFKSAATFEVGPIDRNDFAKFMANRFRIGGRTMSTAVALKVQEIACCVSGDVQELCAAIWDVTSEDAEISEDDVQPALEVIFARERKGFEKSVEHLTPTQAMVLKGLAERPGDRVYGASFLSYIGLANAGAVRKAIQRLEANDLVYEHDGFYRFNDSFLRAWLLKTM